MVVFVRVVGIVGSEGSCVGVVDVGGMGVEFGFEGGRF